MAMSEAFRRRTEGGIPQPLTNFKKKLANKRGFGGRFGAAIGAAGIPAPGRRNQARGARSAGEIKKKKGRKNKNKMKAFTFLTASW